MNGLAGRSLRGLAARWNAFFFRPFDLRVVCAFRALFAALMLANVASLALDRTYFFGADGVLPLGVSVAIRDPHAHTVFELLPDTQAVIGAGLALWALHAVLLLLGWFPRVQAFGVFFWVTAFQHRAVILFDGEDQLLRMFALFLVFIPTDRFLSVHAWVRRRRGEAAPERFGSAWAMRLVQVQMTLVYVGAAVTKARGHEWWDGTAMWYVTRSDDSFGRFPLPAALLDSLPALRALTWATLAFELVLPLALWWPRTRRIALLLAAAFHVAIDYSMMMFLFHPLMLVGLLSFVAPRGERGVGSTSRRAADS